MARNVFFFLVRWIVKWIRSRQLWIKWTNWFSLWQTILLHWIVDFHTKQVFCGQLTCLISTSRSRFDDMARRIVCVILSIASVSISFCHSHNRIAYIFTPKKQRNESEETDSTYLFAQNCALNFTIRSLCQWKSIWCEQQGENYISFPSGELGERCNSLETVGWGECRLMDAVTHYSPRISVFFCSPLIVLWE